MLFLGKYSTSAILVGLLGYFLRAASVDLEIANLHMTVQQATQLQTLALYFSSRKVAYLVAE